MEALAFQYEDLSKKERRKEKRSQRHEHCLASRPEVVAAGAEKKVQPIFSKFEFFSGVFSGDFCFKIERSASSWY